MRRINSTGNYFCILQLDYYKVNAHNFSVMIGTQEL